MWTIFRSLGTQTVNSSLYFANKDTYLVIFALTCQVLSSNELLQSEQKQNLTVHYEMCCNNRVGVFLVGGWNGGM